MLAILQYRSCFPKGQQRSIAASDLNVSIPRAVGLPGVMTDTTFTTVHRPIAASDLNVSIPRAVGLPGVITVTVTNKYL